MTPDPSVAGALVSVLWICSMLFLTSLTADTSFNFGGQPFYENKCLHVPSPRQVTRTFLELIIYLNLCIEAPWKTTARNLSKVQDIDPTISR